MNSFGSEDDWFLQDLEVQDEIEIDQHQIQPNNVILIPQSSLHSEQSHHIAATADALADGCSNEELMLPLLDDTSNDNANFNFGRSSTSTPNLSFSNMCFDGTGMLVPAVFEGVECSEIPSAAIDGNVYSFLSSPQIQYPEPFQFSLQENVVTTQSETSSATSVETNCESGTSGSTYEKQNESTESRTVIVENRSRKTSRSSNSQFVNSWKQLTEKAENMKDRTGAETSIKTVFYNEPFEIRTDKKRNRIRSISTSSGLSGKSIEEKSDHDAEDDHCYAAVILKQRESSPSVSDHQYNQSSPRKQIKRISETECFTRESKLPFYKTKYLREKMLVKYMNSIFFKAGKLEVSAGVNIEVKVCYEDLVFTKENINEARSLLKQRKCQDKTAKTCQMPSITNDLCKERIKHSHGTDDQITDNLLDVKTVITDPKKRKVHTTVIKQPGSETAPAGIHFKLMWNKKCTQASSVDVPMGFAGFIGLNSESANGAETETDHRNNFDNLNSDLVDSNLNNQPFFDTDVDAGFNTIEGSDDKSDSNNITSNPPSVSASCNGHQQEDSNHSTASIRNHFENAENRTSCNTTETQTEPICGICWSPSPLNSLTLTSSVEVFWIRCAQPLCHFLVHPECIGFRVISSSQLMLLPPFHCSLHRN